MLDLGIGSYLFGKAADFTLDKFSQGLTGDLESKNLLKLQESLKDFMESVLQQHKENPDFEQIENFWIENNVAEELISILYKLDSKFQDTESYKVYLEKKFSDFNYKLCFSLIDSFGSHLINQVSETSQFSQNDRSDIYSLIQNDGSRTRSELNKISGQLENISQSLIAKNEVEDSNVLNPILNDNDIMEDEIGVTKTKKKSHLASSIFFEDRFELSFPDVYEKYQIFSGEKIIHNRLAEFFKDCNYFECSPFRKVRGSSLYDISGVEFENDRILFRTIFGLVFELRIERLIVFNPPGYWQKFMMVETKADHPIRIVGDVDDTIVNHLKQEYTYSEGLGYSLKSGGNRKYTVDGILQSIEGDIETRLRYLESYNFFIVPRYHPLAITATCYLFVEELLNNLLEAEHKNAKDNIYEKIYQLLNSEHRTSEDNLENRTVYSYY